MDRTERSVDRTERSVDRVEPAERGPKGQRGDLAVVQWIGLDVRVDDRVDLAVGVSFWTRGSGIDLAVGRSLTLGSE